MKIKTALVIPDLQMPYFDKIAVKAVEKYAAEHWWDYWVQLGDFMDFDYISKFTTDNLKLISTKTFHEDYAYANGFLDRHVKAVRNKNPNCGMALIEGNHEYRTEVAIEKDPRLEGLIEVESNLRLKQRKIKYVRFWSKGEIHRIGKAAFVHGMYTNQYHAQKMVNNYGMNIFYGHTHDVQMFSKVQQGDHSTMVGQSLGTLCTYNQSYMKGKPSNWQQCFAIFYFFPNGQFTYYIPRIFNGRFIGPNGKVYDGHT